MDVLGAACYANDITWWENADGTGTSWGEHTVDDNFFDARSVYAVDVSGDGNLDILGAAQDGNKIAWWNLHAFTELGTLESSILQLNFTPGDSISWGTVTWLCDEPDSTGLAFLVRSSDDATNMGEWSDTIAVSVQSNSGNEQHRGFSHSLRGYYKLRCTRDIRRDRTRYPVASSVSKPVNRSCCDYF